MDIHKYPYPFKGNIHIHSKALSKKNFPHYLQTFTNISVCSILRFFQILKNRYAGRCMESDQIEMVFQPGTYTHILVERAVPIPAIGGAVAKL